ncbi:hypothetical protein [Bradyrhizobium valentinum]|uniref:hypothetical protein n=1 Tax=Bradyrhizobium valentinum TaxID=1518501 RepID=UPI0012E34FE5|nr:hypothetical protein [Bradyrhizobium valentinum]
MSNDWEEPMNPKSQFENLEIMSRERATLAKQEAEHWLTEAEYWLAEAEEWKQLRNSPDPFIERVRPPR